MNLQSLELSHYKVLIVDDVPLNVLLVEKMLYQFSFNVRTAANGLEAMREIIADKPDLVLLDLMMPVMDGFEVIRTVREDPALNEVKIIALSALNNNEDIVRAYDLGVQDFISKPITLEKLTHSVATQLGIPLE